MSLVGEEGICRKELLFINAFQSGENHGSFIYYGGLHAG
jgi:hypothetical protein